jgi:uncharacterized protein (DUF427 family)
MADKKYTTRILGYNQYMKALLNNIVIAESDATIVMEGNHYFPVNSLNMEFFKKSETCTTCPWKGVASYYDILINDYKSKDAAWFYQNPSELAHNIKDHVAFWKDVVVVDN